MPFVVQPVVVPRAEHSISRSQIDPDALKVLYRLHQNGYVAYLVGGSVRDLLRDRRPKDFDIGTSAHPYQVKRLFRNCWIIGRRFRLAHVRFGTKTVEVATFRRQVSAQGGASPQWSHAGNELSYVSEDKHVVTVPFSGGPSGVELGTPQPLFHVANLAEFDRLVFPTSNAYLAAPTGQRFLVAVRAPDPNAPPIRVVVNWRELLKR